MSCCLISCCVSEPASDMDTKKISPFWTGCPCRRRENWAGSSGAGVDIEDWALYSVWCLCLKSGLSAPIDALLKSLCAGNMNNCRNLFLKDGQPQKKHLHTPLPLHRKGCSPLCLLCFPQDEPPDYNFPWRFFWSPHMMFSGSKVCPPELHINRTIRHCTIG